MRDYHGLLTGRRGPRAFSWYILRPAHSPHTGTVSPSRRLTPDTSNAPGYRDRGNLQRLPRNPLAPGGHDGSRPCAITPIYPIRTGKARRQKGATYSSRVPDSLQPDVSARIPQGHESITNFRECSSTSRLVSCLPFLPYNDNQLATLWSPNYNPQGVACGFLSFPPSFLLASPPSPPAA